MAFQLTTATKKIAKLNKRLRCIPGGTSASKTISILLYLIDKAQTDKKPTLTSVVSESFPHLKRGAIRDFLNIIQEHDYYKDERWNKTDYTYTFETGSKIEFFSADQPGKVRGPRRDRLFINEANNVPFETFEQLEIRTSDFIFLDWNPTNEFWYYTDMKGMRDDIDELTLTYKDNEALGGEIVKSIEARKNRPNWWKVYGLGELGEIDEQIYTGWKIIDDVPHEARLERTWLDFGYTNDPSAIGRVYYHNGGWILDEDLYRKGMSNKQLADFLESLEKPQTTIIADSAEPKSIDEIAGFGLNITGAVKGKDSVNNGIQLVQDQPISVTKRSINIIKEYRNYLWLVDKNGKILNEEDPACANHHMAGIRYALSTLGRLEQEKTYWDRIYEDELNPQDKPAPNPAL
jgi:phage terminase large subunit